ncbi:MAG: transporter [Deltaproteobacteria bacterium]|nr:transporter [Deltaproteobacteria bacterium]
MRRFVAVAVGCGVALACGAQPALAEEGGSGHYAPGSMASFIDGVAPKPALLVRLNVLYYSGSAGADRAIPIGGNTALGLDATVVGYGLTTFWRPEIELGERWSYAMSLTIPLLSAEVSANAVVEGPGGGGRTIGRSDSLVGLGDIVFQPLMLNYTVSPDLSVNFRVSLYAPSGSYEVGRLANTGKNFWTAEPTLALIYFGAENGREVSVFTGFDFNDENEATNYRSGNQFHVDGTLAQHLPLLGGVSGLGVSSYYYQQVSGDSGPGASLGDFKGLTAGVGPVVSYIRKLGGQDLMAELKWLREYHTENRVRGDTVFLKVALKF